MNESRKPIEPGCLAIILPDGCRPELDWQQVEVVALLNDLNTGYWSKYRSEKRHWVVNYKPGHATAIAEHCLMRLDDPDIQDEIKAEQVSEKDILAAMPWTEPAPETGV